MLPYKIRKPIYGGANKAKNVGETPSLAQPPPLGHKDDDPRIYGGNLQRAILADLIELKNRYFRIRDEKNNSSLRQDGERSRHNKPMGGQFAHFKTAFKEARFGCIHNRAVPERIDKGEFAQLIYSCCFYFLEETTKKHPYDLEALTTVDGNDETINTESMNRLDDALFSIFALYTLHQTNTLPNNPYEAKIKFNHPAIHHEEDLQRQWSYLPLGKASEGKIFRRYYKSPVRINRGNYLTLLYLRDVCATIVARYTYQRDNDANAPRIYSLANDGMHVIDRMMNDDSFFSYCEYHGPVGLEGLAGNPGFYNVYYGAEGRKAANTKGKRIKRPIASTSNVETSQLLSVEKLQSICPKKEELHNTLDWSALSSLLDKHQSNLQSIHNELHVNRQRHHPSTRHISNNDDLKPRQRELVEKTLNGLDENVSSYAGIIRDLSCWKQFDLILDNDDEFANGDSNQTTEQHVEIKEPVQSSHHEEFSQAANDLPVTVPSSLSSRLQTSIREALSGFSDIVDSVRQDILKERSDAVAKEQTDVVEADMDVEFDARSVDFSAAGATSSVKPLDILGQKTYELLDEVSVATGAGKKALSALLSASTKNKRQDEITGSKLDEYWDLQEEQVSTREKTASDIASYFSDGEEEFSVSTGAGKNALTTLLHLTEYGSLHKKKKRRHSQQNNHKKSDEEDDSSMSDSSIEVGRHALQSLLSMATIGDAPARKRRTQSTRKANDKKFVATSTKTSSQCTNIASTPMNDSSLDGSDMSTCTGGGKKALAELLSNI